jgi:nuclear GTP-binding protein
MKLLKNYCRNNHIKTSISVGVVGFPNVGKSSVINSLKRARVCSVGSTPGVTKSTQEIHLDKHIKLIDSPGIVFSKAKSPAEAAEAILRNCVKVELVEDPISPVEVIISRMKKEQLMMLYNIPFFNTTTEFLIHIARQKGRIRKGGIPDLENSARAILTDWNAGRIPFFTTPPASGPAVDTHVSASLVEGWSKEFEMGELIAVEGKDVLPGVKSKCEISGRFLSMQSSSINSMDLQEDEEEDEDMDDDDEEDEYESDESEMDEDE